MEFKYRAVQDRRTPPPPPPLHPLSTGTYVFDSPLRGYEFSSGGYPSNVLAPRVFLTPVPVNVGEAFRRELEKKQILRELEKEEIRREILAREMAQRRELEEEVMREITVERVLGISFREQVSMSLNQNHRMNKPINNNIFGGSQPRLPPQIDIKQSNKDKAKPDVDPYGAKRKAGKPPTIDDNHHSGFSVEKKPKREWSCGLCQITTTNEKGLNNHLEGKKHKAKASLRTKKIGLDARLDGQKLQRGITSTNIGILEPRKEDQVVQNSQGLGGLDNENEIATSKETGETNALTKRKKFKFYCAFCKVQTASEIIMQSHKNGKRHLAMIKKFSQNNVVANFY